MDNTMSIYPKQESNKPDELVLVEQLIDENQYKEALQVLEEFEQKKDISLIDEVICLFYQGRLLMWQGKHEDSIEKVNLAYEKSLGLEKSLLTLDSLNLMALQHNWQGRFDKSYVLIKKSEKLTKNWDFGSYRQ